MNNSNRRLFGRMLIWALAVLFLWLALRNLDWPAVGHVLGSLTAWQILILIVVNTLIVLLFGARWWLILRAQGFHFPLLKASAYRLAAFGVSYFTPGPHIGGEPLQVYLAVRKEKVPVGIATASVALDKLIELASNFAFLAFGVVVLLTQGLVEGRAASLGLGIAFGLLAVPLGYLFLIGAKKTPLTSLLAGGLALVGRRPDENKKIPDTRTRVFSLVESAEFEAVSFVSDFRGTFYVAVLLSGIVWIALVFEYVLAVRFLGLDLGFLQVISVITAARLAILLPMPGAIGALEAALVLVTQVIGYGTAFGVSLSLLIRVRDIMFGLIGLWLGRTMTVSK